MNTREQILQILRETGDFVSGQQICAALGVSRTAVWKAVVRLREEGYPIEAVTNKGYRLLSMEERDLFNREELKRRIRTAWAGQSLEVYDRIDSTNTEAFRLSEQGAPHGTLVAAGAQTSGKGRRGRIWQSPPDVNLYMSLLLKPEPHTLSPDRAPMLTLVAALAVRKAVSDLTEGEQGYRPGIKWPNDIVLCPEEGDSYRKLCGILTEMRLEDREIRDIVVGIGINVNQDSFPEEISGTATSLKLSFGHLFNRTELAAEVLKHFEPLYESFLAAGDLRPLKDEYESGLVNRGKAVRVLDPVQPFEGTAEGITPNGELIVLRNDTGERCEVGAGEVSVRGAGGYV